MFFTWMLTVGPSLVSEWHTRLQVSSVYFGWSQQCYSLFDLDTSYFHFLTTSKCLSIFLLSFVFNQWSVETAKLTRRQDLSLSLSLSLSHTHTHTHTHFFLINTGSRLLAWIGWSICISKSHRFLCVLFSRTENAC